MSQVLGAGQIGKRALGPGRFGSNGWGILRRLWRKVCGVNGELIRGTATWGSTNVYERHTKETCYLLSLIGLGLRPFEEGSPGNVDVVSLIIYRPQTSRCQAYICFKSSLFLLSPMCTHSVFNDLRNQVFCCPTDLHTSNVLLRDEQHEGGSL